jgi:hexosaminidase
VSRLPGQLRRLDALGVNYRVPDVVGLGRDRLTLENTVRVELTSPLPGAAIHYSVDGSEPTAQSPRYDAPLRLRVTPEGTLVRARAIRADGRSSAVTAARFARTSWVPAERVPAGSLSRGVLLDFLPGAFRTVAELQPITAARTETAAALPTTVQGPRTGLRVSGYLHVPADGLYTFLLTSRDGSRLSIAGRTVVDHDGPHGITTKEGQIALRAGDHPFEAWLARVEPGQGFRIEMESADGVRRIIPAEWLMHRPRP